MKLKITLIASIMFLAVFSAAGAQEKNLSGEITIIGESVDVSGNKASMNKYDDSRDGFAADINLNYQRGAYFIDFAGQDLGRNNLGINLEGGKYGKFKYFVDYDQTRHNFTFDARTFYRGVGTSILDYTGAIPIGGPGPTKAQIDAFASAAPATVFDYYNERKKLGAGIELSLAKPFFFRVSADREEKKGIKANAAGALTGGGFGVELPEPIDYRTDVLKVDLGYAEKGAFLGASLYLSEFRNEIEKLHHRNPAYTTTAGAAANRLDVLTLPPDNRYYKFNVKGALSLPLKSRLAANVGFSRTKGDYELLSYRSDFIKPLGIYTLTLSDPIFNGEIDSQNVDIILTTSPLDFLDGKIFYKHYRKSNKSDQITTWDITTNTTTLVDTPFSFKNHLFDYSKENIGASFDISLPGSFELTPSASYLKVNRDRGDFPETVDYTYGLDLKWTGLEMATAKIGYERLQRTGDWKLITLVTGTQSTADNIEPHVRRYDVAPQNRDTYKVALDFFPMEALSLAVGYRHKRADFRDTVLGLREDKSDNIHFDIGYNVGKFLKLHGYYDYEKTKSFQFQRRLNPSTIAGVTQPITAAQGNPASAAAANFFNWQVEETFTTDGFGAGADIFILPEKLTLSFRYDSVKSDGLADYNLQWLVAGQTQDNIDLGNWEDYRQQIFSAKAIYAATKALTLTIGYAYEKYDYLDAMYDGYRYVATNAAGTQILNYLTGAYSNLHYDAHKVYVGLTYRF